MQLLYIIVPVQVVSGVLLTMNVKFMYKQQLDGKLFDQTYFQAMVSFVGQTFNFVIYMVERCRQQSHEPQQQFDKLVVLRNLMVPALFHMITQILGFLAYMNINASLAMMLSSCLPLVTAILSRIFLNKKVKRHEMQGILIIMLGTIVIGFYTYFYSQSDKSSNITGIVLCILSTVTFGFLTITEQISLEQYHLSGSLIAGSEGSIALLFSIILLPLINYIMPSVDYSEFMMFFNNNNNVKMSVIALPVIDMVYTLMCILCTKYSSALTRSIIYQFRVTGVWLTALFVNNPEYLGGGHWETFSFQQLIGYIMLIVGCFVYSGDIRLSNPSDDSHDHAEYQQIAKYNIEMSSVNS